MKYETTYYNKAPCLGRIIGWSHLEEKQCSIKFLPVHCRMTSKFYTWKIQEFGDYDKKNWLIQYNNMPNLLLPRILGIFFLSFEFQLVRRYLCIILVTVTLHNPVKCSPDSRSVVFDSCLEIEIILNPGFRTFLLCGFFICIFKWRIKFIQKLMLHNKVCNINFIVYVVFQKLISENLKLHSNHK